MNIDNKVSFQDMEEIPEKMSAEEMMNVNSFRNGRLRIIVLKEPYTLIGYEKIGRDYVHVFTGVSGWD